MIFPFPLAQYATKKSTFSPDSVAGLQLWLDSSDASTITQSSGSVSQWNDKSGNNNNAVQATGSLQPTYPGTSFNGLSTVSFNGNGYLGITPITLTNCTVFIVAGSTDSSGNPFLASLLDGNVYIGNYSGSFYFSFDEGPSVPFTATASARNFWGLSNVALNTSTANVGTSATASYGSSLSGSISDIGGRRAYVDFVTAKMGEVLIYDTALTSTQITQVLTYLSGKWGTP
jgi:hypothetical protein